MIFWRDCLVRDKTCDKASEKINRRFGGLADGPNAEDFVPVCHAGRQMIKRWHWMRKLFGPG